MSSDFIVFGNVGGYYDESGHFIVCEEYDLTDFDTDKYAAEVMNGLGYYSEDGRFIKY